MENVIEILKARGLLDAVTGAGVAELASKPAVVYAGFDPSSDSLQVGNLVAITGLVHFQRQGHRIVAVAGGATGLIGDPSGKADERSLPDSALVEHNLAGIKENLSRFLDFEHPTAPAKIVNNNDWMKQFTFVDFLRDVGRHFRLSAMLNKESVRSRMEGETGMSFAEFSYQLMQSYDFLHLFDTMGCRIQIGGSDQWGNITAGVELIRKLRGEEVFGVTFPLVCDSAGRKFGKSEGNALYLDRRRTSYYKFYQFFLRTSDADVVRFLKMFTFLSLEEIEEMQKLTLARPEARIAQKRLAEEITLMVHGRTGLSAAAKSSEVLFGGSVDGLRADDLTDILADVPSKELPIQMVANAPVANVAALCGLCKSKGEARRLVESGGLYINNRRVSGQEAIVSSEDIIDGRVLALRSGKKTFFLVRIAGTELPADRRTEPGQAAPAAGRPK